jgi:hypothetical protein
MDFYANNLSILQKIDPALTARVQSSEEDAVVNLHNTTAGTPTIFLSHQNETIALHHPSNPMGQSQEFLDSLQNWQKSRNIAILGGGLMYVPYLVIKNQPKLRNLYIFEPSLSVFRLAMQTVDMAPFLSDKRFHFIVGNEPAVIYNALMANIMELIANPLFAFEVPSITSSFQEWTILARQQIQDAMQFGQSGLKTKFNDGPLTIDNLLCNLPNIVNAPGLKDIKHLFQNIPAIIVAAGPSLRKNMHLLKEAQQNFLIIATDTAFEPLLREGIEPHMVVSVDPTLLNMKHFPTEKYEGNTIFVLDPEARPEISQKFDRCITYMTDKHQFFEWLDQTCGEKGIIVKGGMVSQAGLFTANYLGCSPIVLIGQDLSLDPKSGLTHDPDAAICRTVQYVDGNPHQVDIPIPDPNNPHYSREPLFWVDGVDGAPVPTVRNLLVYLRMMESDVESIKAPVIDATEGGAKIRGTTIQSLEKTISTYKNESNDIYELIQQIPNSSSANTQKIKEQLIDQLKLKLYNRIDWANLGLQQLHQSKQISINQLNAEIEKYRSKIFDDSVAEYLIEYGAPKELFEFLILGPANVSDEQEKKQTMKRLEALLKAVTVAVERMNNIFDNSN